MTGNMFALQIERICDLFVFAGHDLRVLDTAVAGDRYQGVRLVKALDLLREFAGVRF